MNAVDILKYGQQTVLQAIDGFPVYMYYGHKREHSAQIAAFHDGLR